MDRFSRKHLADGVLLSGLKANVASERGSLADVLADIGEVEERKLYVPVGYESMFEYCTRELRFSKDAAYKRVHAARAALEFPAIYDCVATGALGLRVVNMLAPYLDQGNVHELLILASFKTREEVRGLLAERFPQESVATTIEPIAQPMSLAGSAPGAAGQQVPGPGQGIVKAAQVQPLATDLYKLQLTMSGAMYAKLRRAVELFGRRKPVPDEGEILELGLDLVVQRLEKKRFAATDRPKAARRSDAVRHISNEVKRDVYERDGGRCTFTSADGTRCTARMDLEWEHVVPVARGGTSEASNIKLLCRAHNQYEAERIYGKSFMQHKREQAKAEAARRRAEKESKRVAQEALDHDELMPALRGLGCTIAEARVVLARVGPMDGASMEARMKRCLSFLAAPHTKVSPNGGAATEGRRSA